MWGRSLRGGKELLSEASWSSGLTASPLALQKGRAVPRLWSPVYNTDTVLLLCQAEGRLAVCSVKTFIKTFQESNQVPVT